MAKASDRGRYLAVELRRLRGGSGLTGTEVAGQFGWTASKVSRIETAATGISMRDLRRLLEFYQVPEPKRQELLDLGREAGSRRERAVEATGGQAEASLVLEWAAVTVPALLQTRDYAMAVALGHQAVYRTPSGVVERALESTLSWQGRLTGEAPLSLQAVLDESVLQRRYGLGLMVRQLEHLAEVAQLPNVELRVLKLADWHPSGVGSFMVMEFARLHGVGLPDAVVCEHVRHSCRLEVEAETHPYRLMFSELWERASSAAESARIIKRAADKWAQRGAGSPRATTD